MRTLEAKTMGHPVKLSEVQIGIIEVFVRLLHLVGLPKSAGEIYGLLFTSAAPLTFEEIVDTLRISSGSVSQGLRLLRSLGAVRTTYVAGDRRDHYLAEADLSKLATGFLRENIEHRLAASEERILRLNDLVARPPESTTSSSHEFLAERVETLRNWNRTARTILPIVIQVLR